MGLFQRNEKGNLEGVYGKNDADESREGLDDEGQQEALKSTILFPNILVFLIITVLL